ncbi:hypothetical protein TNCV_3828231 [Trichonephila clavipes]|nr:hypothetical protein TNCV_3828231 [Trichonephila clavipes]
MALSGSLPQINLGVQGDDKIISPPSFSYGFRRRYLKDICDVSAESWTQVPLPLKIRRLEKGMHFKSVGTQIPHVNGVWTLREQYVQNY